MHISERQQAIIDFQQNLATIQGKWNKSSSGDGAHYLIENRFWSEGIKCGNCIFYLGIKKQECAIVEGQIIFDAVCKLWVIPEDKMGIPIMGEQWESL